jgi:hypothetical protein
MNQPPDDQMERLDRIRPAHEIATRALALFGIVGIGLGTPRNDVVAWLKETGLWRSLSPSELRLVEAPLPTRQMIINVSWLSEALTVLLWALGRISELPPADVQCDTALFKDILPPFAEISEAQFVATASRRPDEELLRLAEDCMNLHAESRLAERTGHPPRYRVDTEIIQERHHAINWVIGYEGLAWDLVTTDI